MYFQTVNETLSLHFILISLFLNVALTYTEHLVRFVEKEIFCHIVIQTKNTEIRFLVHIARAYFQDTDEK